jgi:hypothetical protein
MLGAVVAEVALVDPAEENTGVAEKAGRLHIPRQGPVCRAVRGDGPALARTPKRSRNGGAATDEPARGGDLAGTREDVRRVSVEVKPPDE